MGILFVLGIAIDSRFLETGEDAATFAYII